MARTSAPAAPPHHARASARRAGHGGVGRRWALAAFFGVLVALGCAAWLARDALIARQQLVAAGADVVRIEQLAKVGGGDGAAAAVSSLQEHAGSAHGHTSGPLWSVADHLPWVGAQTHAVRTVAAVVDSLARDALPPLVDVAKVVNPHTLAPVDGRVELGPLRAATPRIVAADDAVQAAQDRLDAIDTKHLLAAVATPLAQLRDQVDAVDVTVGTAARAAVLVPAMLGADGPRDYLVLVQNNAEPRATGGIPGSVLHLRAQDGRVQVVEQVGGGALAGLTQPALPLTDSENALFGPLLGTDMRDVNFTPDFPRSAQLAAAIWKQREGATVDGVMSVDPGTLAHVLGATGPLTLPDGSRLTKDNAVDSLLNGVYLRFTDPKQQDAYFAATAAEVLSAAVGGRGSPTAVLEALAQSAREGRLMLWSSHDDEQRRLSGTVLSGELRGSSGASPVIGVYLNDGTQAKMGYYLDLAVTGRATQCTRDGSQLVELTVKLTSTAPANAASLPAYVTGDGAVVPPGVSRTNVLIYAPDGGSITSVRVNSSHSGAFSQVQDGLQVVATTLDLAPGQSGTLALRVGTGHHPGDIHVRVTPLAHGPVMQSLTSACAH